MYEFLLKGGPIMAMIFAASGIAVWLFASRYFALHRAGLNVEEFLQGISNLVRRRHFAEALHECAGTPGPVARVIHAALTRHESPRSELKEIVEEAAQLEVPKLEYRLGALATLAVITPLIGLLGTVTGMIDIFSTVSSLSGYATATDLSAGIYKSLLTSAAGLMVAIPTYAGYMFLSAKVNRLMHEMERAGIEIVNLITEASPPREIISFEAPHSKSRSAD